MFRFLSQINSGFSLWDRYKSWRNPQPIVTNTAQRFIRLFEAHGVARAQIPRFFGHNLTIHQVEQESELLKALNADVLEAAAILFGVRVEWLEGGSEELYDIKYFYKQPKMFGDWLDALLQSADGHKIDGWLLTSEFMTDEYDALILMREKVGEVADEPIYRYHFCEQWIYGYWKCRADIAACVAQAWKRNCYVSGRMISPERFNKLTSFKHIPNSDSEQTLITNDKFYAEDLTTSPEFYVKGLDEGHFGINNAVALWLEYHQQGLMDSGFGEHGQAFKGFSFLKEEREIRTPGKYAGLKSRTLRLSSRLKVSLQRCETGREMFITFEIAGFKYIDKITKYSEDESGEFYRVLHTERGVLGFTAEEWGMFNELNRDVTPDLPRFVTCTLSSC
ncbi:hypothetical protein EKG38_13030 [Shewanella canadensis]|uniref:Uncharacterized protein n=1 Tax=Shewanella canadensis TaxID=271096 RepID=A0A431WTG1_9GAMM|nr:hypothetical protein [Shewanella canadensis]RTR38439.1 hypothetical protein EKG38_13030 [Shewanella canadensis]